jgi:peroxiredoxin
VSGEEPEDLLQRLDPDRAAQTRAPEPGPPAQGPSPETFNPRRYQWLAGLFGLALVIGFSISQFSSHGIGTAGIPPGRVLPPFAAPLASSTLVGDANLHPPCTEADHDPRALNVCLDIKHGPLVLGFFVTGSGACVQAVDAMQAIASQFSAAGVQFAAVAVRSGPAAARTLVRKHGWTIPVAYDRDGAVGEANGVVVCPLLELVRRGGVVQQRLIGKNWSRPAALAAQVRALVPR